MPTFKIEEQDNNTRLDKFLTAQMPGSSRSQIQKMIKDGAVTVSGKKISVHRFLKNGDIVTIVGNKMTTADKKTKPAATPTDIAPIKIAAKNKNELLPKIIFEDDNILVIDKPAGLLTHARDEKLFDGIHDSQNGSGSTRACSCPFTQSEIVVWIHF